MLRGHGGQLLSPCISRLVMAITGSQALNYLFSSQQVMATTDSQVLECRISSQQFKAAQALKSPGKILEPIFNPGLWAQVPRSRAALRQPLRLVTFLDVYHTMSLHGVDLPCRLCGCLGPKLEPGIPQVAAPQQNRTDTAFALGELPER